MNKIHCSVPILTLNSGKYLEKCLTSVRDFDDVYIVDGNSTDDTHEIAKRHGARIHKQVDSDEPNVRIADFSAVRLKAYALARLDWILILDSDEYLSEGLIEEIRAALRDHGSETDLAFTMERRPVIAGKEVDHSFSREVPIRLYNAKSGVAYRPDKPVHEKLFVPKETRIVEFVHPLYSEEPASYKEGRDKDDFYLSIVWNKMRMERAKGSKERLRIFGDSIRSMLRAVKILVVSCGIYLRFGRARSLPFSHVVRHARYHARMSLFRMRQFLNNFIS